MVEKFKKNPIMLIGSVLSFLLGLYFIFGNENTISNIIFAIIGIVLIIIAVINILDLKHTGKNDIKDYIFPIITIVLAILIMTSAELLLLISGIYLIVEVMIIVSNSKDKKAQLKFSSPKLILGIVLILLCINIIRQYIIWCVGLFLIFLAGFLIYAIIKEKSLLMMFTKTIIKTNKIRKDVIDVEEKK